MTRVVDTSHLAHAIEALGPDHITTRTILATLAEASVPRQLELDLDGEADPAYAPTDVTPVVVPLLTDRVIRAWRGEIAIVWTIHTMVDHGWVQETWLTGPWSAWRELQSPPQPEWYAWKRYADVQPDAPTDELIDAIREVGRRMTPERIARIEQR